MFDMGRVALGENATGASSAARILHIKQPQFPQFRFEWHPQTERVYVIRIGALPEVGEVLAHHIDTHGAATNAVLIWLRGFREGSTPAIGGLSLADRQRAVGLGG